MRNSLLLFLGLAWWLAGCKSSSGFSGSTKQTGKTETAAATRATTSTDTRTVTSTDTGSVTGVSTATETSGYTGTSTGGTDVNQGAGPTGEVDGHQIGASCDQCFQIASNLAQAEGFTASKNAIHNYGAGIFQDAPALCDIHWGSPNGPQEVFTACDCSCFP